MAFLQLAQATGKNTDHNTAVTGTLDSTGATFGIIVLAYQNSAAIAVSDNKGNTWALAKVLSAGANQVTSAIYYSNLVSVGTGHTFSVSGTGDFPNILAAVFSGGQGVLDQSNGGSGSSETTQATGSVTPTYANELLIAAVCASISTNTISAINSSFTQYATSNADANNFAGSLAYQIQTTITARNPTWTGTQSAAMAAAIATFSHQTGLAADSSMAVSSTTALQATTRFQADATLAFSTGSVLTALAHVAADSTIACSTSSTLTARSSTRTTFTLNGVDVSAFSVIAEAHIALGCNGTSDTASVRIKGGAHGVLSPTIGQRLTIDQDVTLFDGEVIEVGLEQDYSTMTPYWRLQASDFAFLLKRHLITQTWVSTNADVIAAAILSAASGDGFTSVNVESGLPAVNLVCVFEDALAALTRLAQMVNASWKMLGKDLYFRSTSTLSNPTAISSSNHTFQKLRYSQRIPQAISRAIVQGGGTLGGNATVVSPGAAVGASVIPLSQALGFASSGNAIVKLPIAGVYPEVDATYVIAYSSVNLGGSVAAPNGSPILTAISSVPSGNVPGGQLYYAQTYRTSAGETGIGPTVGITASVFAPDFTATGSVTLALIQPTDPTVTVIDVYRSVQNGTSTFLFLAGSVTKPAFPAPWPNPITFIDTVADNALGSAAPAAGATCPQGAQPPYLTGNFPALQGVTSVGTAAPAIPPGTTVTLAAVVTDSGKQTTLASFEGTDGLRDGFYPRAEVAVTPALASAIATSILADIHVPAEEARFTSQDAACLPLASVSISLPGVSTTLLIQSVNLSWPVKGAPFRDVRASNQFQTMYQWLRDVNKLLIRPAA